MTTKNSIQLLENLKVLLEQEQLKADEFAKEIEKVISKHFPKSLVSATFAVRFTPAIYVRFGLVKNEKDLPSGIRENDPVYSTFHIWEFDKEGNPAPKHKVEINQGGQLMVEPDPGSHMAMKGLKLGWRNKSGNQKQILKHFDNYFGKAKKLIKANVDKIYGDEKQKAIYRKFV